jgi:uncharacterized protein (DUF3084 family)
MATNRWIAEDSIKKITDTAPELKNTEIIKYLLELGKKYDNAAKSERNAAKSERNAAKSERNAAKRQEVIDILKKM